MNCLILVALLLCCGNNSGCGSVCCGNGGFFGGNSGCGREDDCGCGNNGGRRERREREDCGCNSDFRSEQPCFEQRPFLFNQSSDCGCNEPKNKGCDCDR